MTRYTEDELVRKLARIPLWEMQELFLNCDWLGDTAQVYINGKEYTLYQPELDLLTENNWTLQEYITEGGML